jgi:ribonuclease P protein component
MIIEPGDSSLPRLGLVVPKRLARRAVLRNRIKRLHREAFRRRRCQLPTLDIVVLLRGPAGDLTDEQIRASVTTLWDDLERQAAQRRR